VKRGLWLKSTEVAVKALKNLPEFTDQKELLSFYQEIETLSKLRHVNIVQMFGFCKKDNFLCLVTEFVRGGNLASAIENPSEYPLDAPLQIELALNIVRGMVYLHNQNIIHRDLKVCLHLESISGFPSHILSLSLSLSPKKPANILIESWFEGKTKICDFGLSKVVIKSAPSNGTQDGNESQSLGSPQYAAPELNTNPNHDNKVDVFSFGLILWEIINKESPWPEVKFGYEFADRYASGQRPPIPTDWHIDLRRLISNCWDQSPVIRKTFQQVYQALEDVKRQAPSFNAPLRKPLRGSTSQNLRPGGSPPPTQQVRGAEEAIGRVFGAQSTTSWSAFSTAFGSALNANMEQMKAVEYLFSKCQRDNIHI
jgi:serine/threonine protein kinase